ncbi:UDP-N-acetylmuramate dehydrogenase [Thiovibrio sp. JS02]
MLQPDRLPGKSFFDGPLANHGRVVRGLNAGERSTVADKESKVMADWLKELQQLWPGELLVNPPMSRYCTLRVGGPARAVASPADTAELAGLLAILEKMRLSWHVIGRGSNLLVPDAGYDGVIILLGRKFAALHAEAADRAGLVRVRVEAGCGLMKLVNWCLGEGLSGLEFAIGIPGSVGGAVAMNAGAWGSEMAGKIAAVTFIDRNGQVVRKARTELHFSYRKLATDGMVVTAAEFGLCAGNRREMREKCRELLERRKAKQPQGMPSAGSFFKNPAQGPAAGKLIEDAGLKGRRIGGAQVSPQHANFLVNTGGATARDFLELMGLVQEKVRARFGIWLEPEVKILPARSL